MSRRLPTILILLVQVLIGAMYWVDLTYYTNPSDGFVTAGALWMRYAVLLVPLAVSICGLRTVGARAISTMRVKSPLLCGAAVLAALAGMGYAVALLLDGIDLAGAGQHNAWNIVVGTLFLWYGVWMLLSARHLLGQKKAAPTSSAMFGILAALPFCAQTIYRVLVKPTTLHRIAPFVKNFSALFAMLWFGVLLRALYIALTRNRVRWMYLIGIIAFLLCTCLEFTQTVHSALYSGITTLELLEGVNLGAFGLVAGLVSMEIAAQPDAGEEGTELVIPYKRPLGQ